MMKRTLLGILVGTAAGTAKYIDSKEWEDFGEYIAWGGIIGAASGMIVALIEGSTFSRNDDFTHIPSRISISWEKDDSNNAVPHLYYTTLF